MKSSHIIIVLVLVTVAGFTWYTVSGGQSAEEYAGIIAKEREEKNNFMKSGEGSPFIADSTFSDLNYFDPDLKYRITAQLEPVEKKKMIVLSTSDGLEKRYMEFAHATFNLDGIENKLLILEIMETGPYRGTLFLAFADATSTIETYGAGRYLDVKKVPGNRTILLDFNKTYNPYCAYSDDYSCPLPPRENILAVEIRAGEKNYTKD